MYRHIWTWALSPFINLWENSVFVADPWVHMGLAHKRNWWFVWQRLLNIWNRIKFQAGSFAQMKYKSSYGLYSTHSDRGGQPQGGGGIRSTGLIPVQLTWKELKGGLANSLIDMNMQRRVFYYTNCLPQRTRRLQNAVRGTQDVALCLPASIIDPYLAWR